MTRIWWFPSLPLVESEVPKSDVIVPSGKRRPFKWQTSQHLSADVCPNTKKECDNDNSVFVNAPLPTPLRRFASVFLNSISYSEKTDVVM